MNKDAALLFFREALLPEQVLSSVHVCITNNARTGGAASNYQRPLVRIGAHILEILLAPTTVNSHIHQKLQTYLLEVVVYDATNDPRKHIDNDGNISISFFFVQHYRRPNRLTQPRSEHKVFLHSHSPRELLHQALCEQLADGHLVFLAPGYGDARVQVVDLGSAERYGLVAVLQADKTNTQSAYSAHTNVGQVYLLFHLELGLADLLLQLFHPAARNVLVGGQRLGGLSIRVLFPKRSESA